ncbi:MAG: zinc ribbon domain-containing protein [Acidimicrobiales bacterium]
MQLLAKKAKCPLCGAKNPPDAARCGICTRPLANDPLPSQAVYQEALWSTKIATKQARKKASPSTFLSLIIVLGVLLNYFVLGFGPEWLHEPKATPKAADWQVFSGNPDFKADLPGHPMETLRKIPGSGLNAATVWVDANWDLLRDDETQSVAALDVARRRVHAQLTAAAGPAPADVAASIPAIVGALAPGSALADGGVTAVDQPAYGEQFDLVTTYVGWPDESGSGTVRAHVVVFDGKLFVAATFVHDGDDEALHRRLVSTFVPTGSPA